MAVICLGVGILAGYFGHQTSAPEGGKPQPVAVVQPAAEQQQAAPQPPPTQAEMKAASAEAAQSAVEKLKADPKNVKLLVQAGEMYYHHRAFAEAGAYYKRALEVEDSVPVRNQYASALFYANQPDAALEQYGIVLKSNPKNDIALFNSGMIKLKAKNDPKGAVKDWEKLLATNPKHPHRAQVEQMIERAKTS